MQSARATARDFSEGLDAMADDITLPGEVQSAENPPSPFPIPHSPFPCGTATFARCDLP
jgi:hypothetical protein